MRRFFLPVLLLAAAETAAVACSCVMPPTDASERRRLAREVAHEAVALVEVEVVSTYDTRTGRGERLTVRRTLAGRAPAAVELERRGLPSSAACDVEFRRGQRALLLLYPPRQARRGGLPRFRTSSSCTSYLLASPPFRAVLIEEMARRRR